MSVRNIVKIDEDKCNGCGKCADACAERAIAIINGKAKLVSEIYCDGLGACIGSCPCDAITVEQRDSADFDAQAVGEHIESLKQQSPSACPSVKAFTCPGSAVKQFTPSKGPIDNAQNTGNTSQLGQWPVLLNLVPVNAPYFKNADLLLTADCVPVAMGDFHSRFLKGKAVAVGCPKFDNAQLYIEKLADIISKNNLKSLTVLHMQVPCCSGLSHIAREALKLSGVEMTIEDITVSLQGEVLKTETF